MYSAAIEQPRAGWQRLSAYQTDLRKSIWFALGGGTATSAGFAERMKLGGNE